MPGPLDLKSALLRPLETAVVPATARPVVIRDLFKKNRKEWQTRNILSDFRRCGGLET
jgi:hypothetical protein